MRRSTISQRQMHAAREDFSRQPSEHLSPFSALASLLDPVVEAGETMIGERVQKNRGLEPAAGENPSGGNSGGTGA
ncbi:MAG: hypothetical protein LLG06_01365 [Desulfobacteraceae bacterium]|nr:hypothetical protein [Desulfobacteraceae bacterium]